MGLDLSLTRTGVAFEPVGEEVRSELIPTTGRIGVRLKLIRDAVKAYLYKARLVELVLIEGHLNHSYSAGTVGMVHGAVRVLLQDEGIPYATIPPTSLKRYATGRGNADKAAMILAAYKRSGREFIDDNQCDAWWLFAAAKDHLGCPVVSLPQTQRDALRAITMEE